jgi:hypothetical protein
MTLIQEVINMTKRLFFLLGVLAGFLCAEVVRRQRMERLRTFEAKEARRKANNAYFEREWQKELAAMPFAERMDYELFEASLKANDWQPAWDEEDDDASAT